MQSACRDWELRSVDVNQAKFIYLDHNATTPCAPEVVEAMLPYFGVAFGNSGSPHRMGRAAAAAVDKARGQVAGLLDCEPAQIVFTSGATESNNLALLGVAAPASARRKIVTTAVEHRSVLAPCEHLGDSGFEIIELPVDREGVVDLNAAEEMIDEDTLVVSIQRANNETGTLQPVAEVVARARARGALVHSDCAQALGKIPISMVALGVDLVSCSAHKMYGPKGVGALFVRDSACLSSLKPLVYGGAQEGGLRSGTLNVPGIVGFGEACRLVEDLLPEETPRLAQLRDSFERQLVHRVPDTGINGARGPRLPGTSSVTFPGLPADLLLSSCNNICISDGAACSYGTVAPSHVLAAMGVSRSEARQSVRVSLGRYTSRDDIDHSVRCIADTVVRLLEIMDPAEHGSL